MKKMVLVIFLGLAMTVFGVGSSQAAAFTGTGWYVCEVYSAGPVQSGQTTYYIATLTDTAAQKAFDKQQFVLATNIQKELLATMLTAVASTLKVRAYIVNGYWVNIAYAGNY